MIKGGELEKLASAALLRYAKAKKALILKIPVPIEITAQGLISKPSTVDYAGVLEGGRFIAFDAKDTKSKTSFPLQNIHEHQLSYLLKVADLGGIAFFLIRFAEISEDDAYIVPPDKIKEYWDIWEAGGKASIKLAEFKSSFTYSPITSFLDQFYDKHDS